MTGIADLPALPNGAYALVGTGDFNGDGKPDILWRNHDNGANAVWYMDGVTLTGIAGLPPSPMGPGALWERGISTEDGKPDILWRNTTTGAECGLVHERGDAHWDCRSSGRFPMRPMRL